MMIVMLYGVKNTEQFSFRNLHIKRQIKRHRNKDIQIIIYFVLKFSTIVMSTYHFNIFYSCLIHY